MIITLNNPYTEFIDKMIALGYANDADEVVKQSLLIYQNQLEIEEFYLVDKAVSTELNVIRTNDEELIQMEEVFDEAGR